MAATVTWMLGLDQDLSDFYAIAANEPKLAGAAAGAEGRILRSPTLFEDVVKTILTTNTVWGSTKRMVANVVNLYGDPLPADPDRVVDLRIATLPTSFGERAVIRYRYAELLAPAQGVLRLAIPTVIAPRYGQPELAVQPHQVPGVELLAAWPFALAGDKDGGAACGAGEWLSVGAAACFCP